MMQVRQRPSIWEAIATGWNGHNGSRAYIRPNEL